MTDTPEQGGEASNSTSGPSNAGKLPTLEEVITRESRTQPFPAAASFVAALKARYGESVQAVLFYGSCLQQGTDEGLMLDFYVLANDLPAAIGHRFSALMARLLPPNVYYHEHEFEGRTVRAKVAVMHPDDFILGVSNRARTSALWARFAQPTALAYVVDDATRARLEAALAMAARTMLLSVLPLMKPQFTPADWWVAALRATYGAELRPEKDSKPLALVENAATRFTQVALAVAVERGLPVTSGLIRHLPVQAEVKQTRRRWRVRRVVGKTANALRLIKALFTFQAGIDYAVWKMERHSGVHVPVTDFDRRFPLIGAIRVAWRARRSGAVK